MKQTTAVIILALGLISSVGQVTLNNASFVGSFSGGGGAAPPADCTTVVGAQTGTSISIGLCGYNSDYVYAGSCWIPTNSGTFCKLGMFLHSSGSPTSIITAYFYTNNVNIQQPGILLATSSATVSASTLTASEAEYTFAFPSTAYAASGNYSVVVSGLPTDNGNYFLINGASAGAAYALVRSGDGLNWTSFDSFRQIKFKAYGQ